MEQDEMKLAWKELNEKINASSLANKKTLEYILETRRKSAWQKLVTADKSASLFLILTMVISCIILRGNNGFILMKIQAITMLLVGSVLNCISYLKLVRMNLNGSVLVLYKQVSSYKKLTVWTYLIIYVLAIIFTFSFLYSVSTPHIAKVLICLIIPIGVAIDCFIYHWSLNHIRTLVDATEELKELNKPE